MSRDREVSERQAAVVVSPPPDRSLLHSRSGVLDEEPPTSTKGPSPGATVQPPRVSLLVCRGCCCGTARKHPGIDHDAHDEVLRASVAGNPRARFYRTGCLGPCERSNVVVVRSGRTKRWFGQMHGPQVIDALARWAAGGAVGNPPPELEIFEFDGP